MIIKAEMASVPQLYLASCSPRRAQLLTQLGLKYEVIRVDIDEKRVAAEEPQAYARRLALDKARAGRLLRPAGCRQPVLGADTIVVNGSSVMGKPRDREQAITMLMDLSAATHDVITAIALAGATEHVMVQSSHVTFRTLTEAECAAYWDTGEPRDKAGGYAVQGVAAMFIARLEGSYSGVMGLPLYETAGLLRAEGIEVL